MLLEQYKVATLDYSYIVPNFPLGYGRLATSFPRSPLLLFYEMILETRVRVNISTLRGKYWPKVSIRVTRVNQKLRLFIRNILSNRTMTFSMRREEFGRS